MLASDGGYETGQEILVNRVGYARFRWLELGSRTVDEKSGWRRCVWVRRKVIGGVMMTEAHAWW